MPPKARRLPRNTHSQLLAIAAVIVLSAVLAVIQLRVSRLRRLQHASRLQADRLMRQERYGEAAEEYDRVIASRPQPMQNATDLDGIMLYHDYGKALLLGGDAAGSLRAYTEFQVLATKFLGTANYARGSALIQLGRYEDGMKAFDAAIQLNPDLYDGYQNRCATLRLMERYQDAVAACQDTIQRFPGVAKSHLSLGWAYELWGKHDEAIAAYLEAIRLEPAWEFPRIRLRKVLETVYGSDRAAAVERIRPHDAALAQDMAKRLTPLRHGW